MGFEGWLPSNEDIVGILIVSFHKIILIPSADSLEQPAARRLMQLAGPHTEIEVFEPVFDPHIDVSLATGPRDFERIRDQIVSRRLDKAELLAAALRDRNLRASAAAAWDHPLYEAVIRRVVKIDADLVISEPLGGRAGALSNNDWRLIGACPATVLLVHSDGSNGYRNIVAAVDPFHEHAKPADLDAEILKAAQGVQAQTGAVLTAVHCFLPLTQVLSGSAFERLPVDAAESELERFRGDKLNELAAAAGLAAASARLLRGRPADVLLELAAKGAADLIVMGALSRGRLGDLVLGSTAEHIVDRVQADIMIVKPAAFETRIDTIIKNELPMTPIYYPL
jgi:universal stress protein E